MKILKVNPRIAIVSQTHDNFNAAVAAYMLRDAAWRANPRRNIDPATSLSPVADNLLAAWGDLKCAMRGAISAHSFGYTTVKLRPRKREVPNG